MSTFTDLRDYEDHVKQDVATDNYLGRVAWWGVEDRDVQFNTVKSSLEAAGLGDMVPRPPANADVFRRTFSKGERRKHKTGDPNITERLLIREVTGSSERIVRRVVKELVDANGETLSYEQTAQVTYNSNHPEALVIQELEPDAHSMALLNELDEKYQAERGCLDGNGIRSIINRTLASCQAVNLRGRSGGVYFAPETHAARLEALETWASNIPGANVHTLPLLDDRKQRDMVRSSIRSEMTSDIEHLMAECASTLEQLPPDGTVSNRKFGAISTEYANLKRKIEEYNGVLEEQVLGASDRINVLAQQVGQLFTRLA